MGVSTVESVASFSIVLAEVFAAVGLSTVAPAAVVTLAKVVKNAGTGSAAASSGITNSVKHVLPEPLAKMGEIAKALAANVDELHLLVPKKAKIFAEFEFKGSDSQSATVSAGLGPSVTQICSVNAGYTALYSTSSSNKITLDVDFELAKFTI